MDSKELHVWLLQSFSNESDGKYDNRQELEKIEAELTRRNKPALDLAKRHGNTNKCRKVRCSKKVLQTRSRKSTPKI